MAEEFKATKDMPKTRLVGFGTRGGRTLEVYLVRMTKLRFIVRSASAPEANERAFNRTNGMEVGYADDFSGWRIPHEECERLDREYGLHARKF